LGFGVSGVRTHAESVVEVDEGKRRGPSLLPYTLNAKPETLRKTIGVQRYLAHTTPPPPRAPP